MERNFNTGLRKSLDADRVKLTRRRKQLLRDMGLSEELNSTELPDEFDRQTFIDISSRLGMPLSTAERNIKKWTDEGLLIRQDLGHYKKVGK